MSSTGSTGGASRARRIDVTSPATGDGDRTDPAGITPSTVTRTPASTGRHSVATAVTASGSFAAIGGAGTSSGARATGVPGAAVELPEAAAAILPDGTIVPRGASATEGPLAALNALALARAGDAGAFDRVTDKALLSRLADKLVATHAGLTGAAPDDATTLAWRQSRAASLALLAALPADCGPPVSVDEGLFDVGWSDPVGDANAARIRTAFRSRMKVQ